MFDTEFSYSSATPIPPNLSTDSALHILHDFEAVVKLSPDCRGCRSISPPKNGYSKANAAAAPNGAGPDEVQYYEVEDDLPFMPKKFWSGGVKYQADFVPRPDGCDITVHAPAGFTSTNHWRVLRETIPEDREAALERVTSKDLNHAEPAGAGWYVQIVSDAKVSKTFASIVKGFLKNSHAQLQRAFIEKLKIEPDQRQRRPTLGRRRSSVF